MWRTAKREEKWIPLVGVGKTKDLEKPKHNPKFLPDFKSYDAEISTLVATPSIGRRPPRGVRRLHMANGGGFVSVHEADNTNESDRFSNPFPLLN